MIPFKLFCNDFYTRVDQYVKIGISLGNEEDDNQLTCDNFAFEVQHNYDWKTKIHSRMLVLTDGTIHKISETKSEGCEKAEIGGKEYFCVPVPSIFPVLDESDNIKYPFEGLRINFDNTTKKFLTLTLTPTSSSIRFVPLPQNELFKPEMVKKIKERSGVDISRLKGSKYSLYAKGVLEYIDCYSHIEEFRECIDKGIKSAYDWIFYSFATVKKKAKEALAQLGDITTNDLPSYVKSHIEEDKSKDSEKNILSLYRRKFTEEDFKTYRKIFRNFGNVGNKRYECFESFVLRFLGNNVPPKEVLYYITLNTAKGRKFSVAEFFNRFEFFENKKICEHIDVEEEMANAIFAGDFNVKKEEIWQRADELKQLMQANAYCQYENIDLSDVNQWDFSVAIFRIKGKQDIPGHFSDSGVASDILVPDTDEIAFILNTYSTFSDEEGMDKYLIVNLNKQIFRIYGLVELAYSEKKYLGLLYRSDDSQKKTEYFDKYMTEDDIREIKKFLTKYVYPKYVRQRINSMLCI